MSAYLINLRIKDHVATSMEVNTIANVPKMINISLVLYLIDIVLSLIGAQIPKKTDDQPT